MAEFYMNLAGYTIAVSSIYDEVRTYCKDFLIPEQHPDIQIEITPEDIVYERMKSKKEAARMQQVETEYSDAYLETLAVYRKIAKKLLANDVLLFHGSVVAVDGVGYLFTAASGTGKSTHTAYWREVFGERAVMINDDKPLLALVGTQVIAYGTPWNGKHRLGCNSAAPLKSICILKRGETNHLEHMERAKAYDTLYQQVYRPTEVAGMLKTLQLFERLLHSVELYQMTCTMNPEAAKIAYEGMKEKKES